MRVCIVTCTKCILLLCRVGVSDSARAERRAAGGDAELGLDTAAAQPRHPDHAGDAVHRAPAPAHTTHRPPPRRAIRHHPNTIHHHPLRQRDLSILIEIHDGVSRRTEIFKMTY